MSFLGEGEVSLIARLVRAEAFNNEDLTHKNANRWVFEFDTIDAKLETEQALLTVTGRADPSRLAALKILTTDKHFRDFSGVSSISDGQWYKITLLPRGKQTGPLAWGSSLGEDGYEELIPLVVSDLRYLFTDYDKPLKPVGASVDPDREKSQAIVKACNFPIIDLAVTLDNVFQFLISTQKPHKVVVRDVGQASFCSALDKNGNELFHLDAGWPISFNKKTTSDKPKINSKNAPIILSHWDWDHLHGYHCIKGLADCLWIAPIQRLGPGAALVANKLAEKDQLFGVCCSPMLMGWLNWGICNGKIGNLNQTGLWINITLASGKTVLLMGDADYDLVDPKYQIKPDFIVATHHGAKFSGNVVSPNGVNNQCIVSVGKGNGYGHPSEVAIKAHETAGWRVSFTCERGMQKRGAKYLGP